MRLRQPSESGVESVASSATAVPGMEDSSTRWVVEPAVQRKAMHVSPFHAPPQDTEQTYTFGIGGTHTICVTLLASIIFLCLLVFDWLWNMSRLPSSGCSG
jgi:hypothetical protein